MQKRGHLLIQLALNTSHADIVKNKNDCYNFDEEEESCQTNRTKNETKAANHSISSDNMVIPNFNFNNWEWEVNDRNVTKGSDYRRSKKIDLFNLEVENSKKVVKEGNGFINENQEIQVDFEEMQDSAMEPIENEIYNVNSLQNKIEILPTKLLDDNLKNKTESVELAKKNRDGYTNNGFTNSSTSCEQRIQENEEVRDKSNSLDCEIEIDNLANNSFEDSSYCPETSNGSSSNSEIIPYSTNTIQISTQEINSQNFIVNEPLSNTLKKQKQSKLNRCKFCDKDVLSKNFTRHLQRSHSNEKEVVSVFQLPKNSKERRQAFSLLRNSANFDLYIKGEIRPYRERINKVETEKFYPCVTCKGLFLKQYLRRHAKKCYGFKNTNCTKNYLGQSQTLSACAFDKTNVLSTLNVKEKVFDIMKGDQIALEAKKDILIAHYGESYLKKHKRDGIIYACSNRMRELSRLLISFRKVTNNNDVSFKDMLHPKHFDNVLFAARNIVGFDAEKKTFKSPSLAMHLGTSLKLVCEELVHLILKEKIGFRSSSVNHKKDWLENINYFKQLIKNRWNIELSSIANKDLNEKRWKKPLIVPLVSDVKKFRDQTLKLAQDYGRQIVQNEDNIKIFKLFVQSTLALLIIFNRRRIGDIQYLKIKDYLDEHKTNFKDFESVLTEGEKQLTRKYRRVLNSGKGSRAVVILIPGNNSEFY
ncbi:hypothetical protein RN001_007927 [Aquatica leii]|uniref:Uncharacterized protein n=1 Tax=Aquatica leii TaxID=1421715 RepID=A0AAN7S9C0_9COLE|nr:hypothetical protein RN001_007927 [Aquatica leii]